ncbi:T-cell-interacting, activating receptor on myeloid cells protein 1-like isoform 2-T2 [Vipera latastei]
MLGNHFFQKVSGTLHKGKYCSFSGSISVGWDKQMLHFSDIILLFCFLFLCFSYPGQTLPKPLISVSFSGTVALGENVTVFCGTRDDFQGDVYLTRYTSPSHNMETVACKKAESYWTAFSLSCLNRSHGGKYHCRSCLHGRECSTFSDEIYLNLTDPSLTKPTIHILNVKERPYTIRCEGIEPDLTFALLKSKKQIKYKAAVSGEKAVDFFLHQRRLEEAQSYTCQYHQESNPFVWSVPSDPLELPLRDPEMMNPTTEKTPGGPNASDILSPYLWAGIGASVFLIVVLLLAVVVFKKRRKNFKTNENNPAMNLSSDAGEHPDEVSYATLNHQPWNTQQAIHPCQASEPCLYASVAKHKSFHP